jgi:exopolysaccharide biosynthesis protein
VRFSLPRVAGGLLLLGALLTPVLPAPTATAAGVAPAAAVVPGTQLGYDRLTVRRGDTWYLQPDLDGGQYTSYVEQTPGYMPVAGDTDGDGSDSLSLFRDGIWLIRNSQGGPYVAIHFGQKGDIPLLGDWNGDGIDSVGLFRKGHWYLRDNSTAGPTRTFTYGLGTDLPVAGDWDGNGRTDIGVVRNSTWFQRDATSSGPTTRQFSFGNPGDKRFAGDWDHDGRDSPGVFRSGSWFFRESNTSGAYQTTQFGRAGDVPLVRRTQGLADGVSHRVVHTNGVTAHVLTIDLAASSSVDTVLSNNALRSFETTSSMARRSGAVAAVNGDYGLSSGRPVHVFAHDGELGQTAQILGRALGIDASGTKVSMGFPSATSTLSVQTDTGTATIAVPRWNSGPADADNVASFTAAGADLETPPNGDCYAGLAPTGDKVVHPDGGVDTPLQVTGRRCGGDAALVPTTGAILDGSAFHASGDLVASLRAGSPGQLTQSMGFAGAVDVIGGNPMLLVNGTVQSADVDGTGGYFGPNPRTAVGTTGDGKLLIVVVDGREYGYSAGMTLRQLAEFMAALGARDAINLDGGGSSTMWINGRIANRPSDPTERPVSSALVVLDGTDPGEARLHVAPPGTATGTSALPKLRVQSRPEQPLVSPVFGGEPVAGWKAAASDPASIGGLSEALAQEGVSLPPDLQRARTVYETR